jgi:tetratricopeptide (TPR) repeat protein
VSEQETLEDQREFLLRSLDDLEAERTAGNIDDASYERLRGDYIARAAAVVRALRDGVDARPEVAHPSGARRFVVVGGLVAFAVVAGLLLASALGARLPGQTATGNSSGAVSTRQRRADLERAVTDHPDDPAAELALARSLTGERDFVAALRHFDAASRLDPKDPESRAYGGWIVYLAGLTDQALPRINAAIAVDEQYPDAHFFKGIVLLRGKNDGAAAVPELQRYLALAPDSPQADQVRQLLAPALEKPAPSTPTTPTTPTK